MTLSFAPDAIEMWPLARLQPYARNAKAHGADQVAKIAASMAEFGWTVPCLVAEDGELIAGHGRVLAATQLGLTEAPVIVLGHLTEAQRRAYRIADNKLTELGTWDEALLSAELQALLADDFDLSLVGFSDGELDKILAYVPDAQGGEGDAAGGVPPVVIPEPPRNPASRTGDLWILGDHRLLCGDSTKRDDVRRLMNGERAALFATDPPYLVDYDGSNHPTRNKDWSHSYGVTWDDSSQGAELYDGFIAAAVSEAIAEDAAWYCWHASRRQAMLEACWEKAGAFVHQQIIWVKDRGVLTWGTGRFVGRAAGNHLVALWPIRDATDETFWIKSVSPAGLYSDTAAVSTTRLAPLTGRNVVLTSNRPALNWTGVQQGMEVIGGNLLALSRSNGSNLPRGEYVFPIDLGRNWRARNWIDARIATTPANDLTWADASFRWEDPESTSAWLPLGDVDGATVRAQIAIEASVQNDLIEGFRLAGITGGLKGTAATQASGLLYAPARFDQGLRVGHGSKAAWPIAIPSEFSTTFDVRLDQLLDEPLVYLALRGSAGTLRLIWAPDVNAFTLEDDQGRRVSAPLVRRSGDLITFGICQTPTMRRLFAASVQTGAIASGTQPFAPLGSFTSAQLHPA